MPAKSITGITVAYLLETYGTKLELELVSGGAGVHRLIREATINRPALALTGFFKYFANKRIQVLGAAEMTYLKTLTPHRQVEIFTEMGHRGIPCLILSRNYNPTPSMLSVSEQMKLPILRSPIITKKFINAATLCVDNEFAPSCTEHATTLEIKGIGVMIRGSSGIGKSECALALIERGHSLVADDLTCIRVIDERELSASSRPLNRGYMECRGIGIINIAEMFGVRSIRLEKRIDLVVTLHEWTPDVVEERTGLEQSFYEILGIKVPLIEFFVRPGRDIARLIEVAAMVQALKKMGHDPAKDFNDRLIAYMADEANQKPTVHRLTTTSPTATTTPTVDDDDDTDDHLADQ